MINAWEYAYDNYDGTNEDAIVDSIVEQLVDDIYEACDAGHIGTETTVGKQLEAAVRDFILEAINFNEIKNQMENDRDEYFEREKARRGEY